MWRGAGAVERGGLENRCPPCGDRGFKSLPLRHPLFLRPVSGRLGYRRNAWLCKQMLFFVVSGCVVQSQPQWDETGELREMSGFYSWHFRLIPEEAAMARTSKLAAVEVAKAKGPPSCTTAAACICASRGEWREVVGFQVPTRRQARRGVGLRSLPGFAGGSPSEGKRTSEPAPGESLDPISAKQVERQAGRLSAAHGPDV